MRIKTVVFIDAEIRVFSSTTAAGSACCCWTSRRCRRRCCSCRSSGCLCSRAFHIYSPVANVVYLIEKKSWWTRFNRSWPSIVALVKFIAFRMRVPKKVKWKTIHPRRNITVRLSSQSKNLGLLKLVHQQSLLSLTKIILRKWKHEEFNPKDQ